MHGHFDVDSDDTSGCRSLVQTAELTLKFLVGAVSPLRVFDPRKRASARIISVTIFRKGSLVASLVTRASLHVRRENIKVMGHSISSNTVGGRCAPLIGGFG